MPKTPVTHDQLAQYEHWASVPGRRILLKQDPEYPQALLLLRDAPDLIFAEGNLKLLHQPAVAIVGSRHASANGMVTAREFAHSLVQHGVSVVSGLASGIDTGAHEGALAAYSQNRLASTIAVLGCGPDQYYPLANAQLQDQIAEFGCLISEFPPGVAPLRHHFPRRNRLIAALGLATLVVEAAKHSGSLITARLALEIGRDVMAIPGSIHSATSKGCHQLIREGALLVDDVHDILQAIRITGLTGLSSSSTRGDSTASSLEPPPDSALDHLGWDPVWPEQLAKQALVTLQQGELGVASNPLSNWQDWQVQLSEWEVEGLIKRLPDGRIQRVRLASYRSSHL